MSWVQGRGLPGFWGSAGKSPWPHLLQSSSSSTGGRRWQRGSYDRFQRIPLCFLMESTNENRCCFLCRMVDALYRRKRASSKHRNYSLCFASGNASRSGRIRDGRGRDRCLLSACDALTDGPDERKSAESHDQMGCLDQPVQVTHQDHLLRDAKNWHDERIDNPYGSQSSQPAAENRYHRQDQQCEGNNETKQHMDVDEVCVGICAHPKCYRYQRGDGGYNSERTYYIHEKFLSSY